jgi:hypothetical protein
MTEDVFNKIISRLESLGYYKKCDNQTDYEGFCKFESLFFDDNKWDTRFHSAEPHREEVPLSIILGSDKPDEVQGTLRYHDSITPKVFKDLICILEKRGLVSWGMGATFEGFKEYGCIYINLDRWRTAVYSGEENDVISLSDILGDDYNPETKGFPFKVGDTIRCDKLESWSSETIRECPMGICEGKELVVEKIAEYKRHSIGFQASYNGKSYGFAYTDSNRFSLVLRPARIPRNDEFSVAFTTRTATTIKPILISVPKI